MKDYSKIKIGGRITGIMGLKAILVEMADHYRQEPDERISVLFPPGCWPWPMCVYVPVNAVAMLWTILTAIVIPLLLGNLTRIGLVRWRGQKKFMELKPVFPAASALGMYCVFFISNTGTANNQAISTN